MVAMYPRFFMRRLIAVAAAYLLAVQTSMAVFAVMPAVELGPLCLLAPHASDDGTGRAPRDDHAACALCGLSCGACVPPPPTAATMVGWQAGSDRQVPRPAGPLPAARSYSKSAPARAPPV
jgi:hypothetical protein